MKKSKKETARTRQRIVEEATVQFRRRGIANTSVAGVMAAAGLTHGGFYRHFESKHALVVESLDYALGSLIADFEGHMPDRLGHAGVLATIECYMSAYHGRSDPDCPFVSLGSELAREPLSVRDTATAGFCRVVDAIGRRLSTEYPGTSSEEAWVILSTMIGAMSMARLVSDSDLAVQIVSQAKRSLFERLGISEADRSGDLRRY